MIEERDDCPVCGRLLRGDAYDLQTCGEHFVLGARNDMTAAAAELGRSCAGLAAMSAGMSIVALLTAALLALLLASAPRGPAPAPPAKLYSERLPA